MSITFDPKVLAHLSKGCVDYSTAYDHVYPERKGETFEQALLRAMTTPIKD